MFHILYSSFPSNFKEQTNQQNPLKIYNGVAFENFFQNYKQKDSRIFLSVL